LPPIYTHPRGGDGLYKRIRVFTNELVGRRGENYTIDRDPPLLPFTKRRNLTKALKERLVERGGIRRKSLYPKIFQLGFTGKWKMRKGEKTKQSQGEREKTVLKGREGKIGRKTCDTLERWFWVKEKNGMQERRHISCIEKTQKASKRKEFRPF